MMPRSRLSLWIVTFATLFAAVMRFVRIDSLAPAAWYDEIWFALRARELLQTGDLHVFYTTHFGGANAGLVYLTAVTQALGIDTITSARWVLAVSGVLAVPLAYQCFRALMRDRRIGLLAAIFLSYTLFYVIITRVGMESGIAPTIALFVIWQMLIAAYKPDKAHWIAAGLAVGLSQYNGLHARVVVLIAAYLALDLLITSPSRIRTLRGLAIMLVAALIVTFPLISFFIQNPEWLTARIGVVAESGLNRYWSNFVQIARVVSIEGSYDPKTTVPGIPLLDAIQTLGFVIGLLWCAANLHLHQAARLLIVWLILAILPGLLTDGPNLQRMINLAAPLAGITALGWVMIFRMLSGLHTRRSERPLAPTMATVGVTLILISTVWHTHLLFVRWPQEPKMSAQFTAQPVDLARQAIEGSAHMPIYAERAPEVEDVIAWEFLFPNTPVTRLDLRKCLPLPHQRSTPTGYLVLTSRNTQTIYTLRNLYPQSYFRIRNVDLWQETTSWIEIPAGAEAPAPPYATEAQFENGIYLLGYNVVSTSRIAGSSITVTLFWHATEEMAIDYTTFTHIGIEGAPPIAQRDGQPCEGLYPTSRWRAGEVIVDTFSITIPENTPAGEYPISVGWYSYPSLERLPLINADSPLPDQRAMIFTLQVEAAGFKP